MTSPTPHAGDLIAAYALNAVDSDERRLVEDHLRTCAACREELAGYSEAAVHLTDGREVEPPLRLREQILGAVADETRQGMPADAVVTSRPAPSGRPRGLAAIWGLAAAGVIAVGGFAVWQGQEPDLSPVELVVQADDAQRFEVDYEGETLTVVASGELDQAVLLTDDLPGLTQGQVYQAWWIDESGEITSAGVVDGQADPGEVEMPLEGTPDQAAALALSVEPQGGSEQPTTEPLLSLDLAD
ncbi:hypothetical protein BH23ACT6_BH23ACT6_02710 [soil metagenome]